MFAMVMSMVVLLLRKVHLQEASAHALHALH